MDDLINDFIAETREGLEALDSELVRFEQCPDEPETLGGIFRLIHTIKGTCGFLGLTRLQTVAHAAENVLGGFRDGVVPVTPTAVSAVLDTVDLIRALTDALAVTGAEPEGDDSVLIARLEAVLDDSAAAAAAPAAPAEDAPVAPAGAGPSDNRSLIEQLGGDATLDAASEMALAQLQADGDLGALFSGADPDRLQGAVRDSLCNLARRQEAGAAFANAMAEVAHAQPGPAMIKAAFDVVAGALRDLDIADMAIEALRALVTLPAQADAKASAPSAVAVAAPPPPEPEPEPVFIDEPLAAAAPEPSPLPVRAPAPAAARSAPPPQPSAPARAEGENQGPQQTIRVSVDALEHLMTVVSELVLIRNQLIQTLRLEPESPFAAPLNRLNQVTSELQEGVMTTRMQPISGAWAGRMI